MSEKNFVSYGSAETVLNEFANNIKNNVITETVSSSSISITDSADARVQDLRIYGHTESGASVGESGLTVTACGNNLFNINGKVNAGHHWNKTPSWYTDYDGTDKNTVENGVLIANANFSNVNPWGQIIKIKKNTYYTVSFKCISFGSGTAAAFAIYGYTPEQSGANRIYEGFMEELNTTKAYHIKSTSYEGDTVFGFASKDASGAQFADIMIQEGWHDVGHFEYENYKGSNVSISSALPLRGSYGTIDLGDLNWKYQTTAQSGDPCSLPRFSTNVGTIPDAYIPSVEFGVEMSSCSSRYTPAVDPVLGGNTDKTICFGKGKGVYIVDHDYTDATAFKAAVTGIILTYPSYCDEIDLADGQAITRLDSNGDVLATPVVTSLSATEIAAFRAFRTFESVTNITASDDPHITVKYIKNTDNGKAVAGVQDDADNAINAKQNQTLTTSDLTSSVTSGSTAPITSGAVADVAGYCGQYNFDNGTSIIIGMDSTGFRRVTIYQDTKVYSFIVHEWGGTPSYHWILGTELPSGITASYSGYRLTFTNNSFGTARMIVEAPSNPVRT